MNNNFSHYSFPSSHLSKNHNTPAVPFNVNQSNIPSKDMVIISDQKQTVQYQCIVVDSRDRNTTAFPTPNPFAFHFFPSNTFEGAALFEKYHNISSIRLVECILPDFSSSVPYLTLVIPELDDTLSGTNDILKKAFTVLLPDRIFGGILHCRTDGMAYCKKEYNPPKGSFSKWSLSFYEPDGNLHTFGSGEVTLIFEVETKIADRESVMKPLLYQ